MLVLNDLNKVHLQFLLNCNDAVITDFCKLSWEYLVKGPNAKLYSVASQKLETDAHTVQNVVEAVSHLLIESCKHKVSKQKFTQSLISMGFKENQADTLFAFYNAKQTDLNKVLLHGSINLPTFRDLEWRVEANIGSRALPNQIVPNVLMALSVDEPEPKTTLLQASPGDLAHITKTLEKALVEANSQHTRRVQRRFGVNQSNNPTKAAPS